MSQQKVAYDALSAHLTLHQDSILEIEILPPAFSPADNTFLHEGTHLGLTKPFLILAFLEARTQFFSALKDADLLSAVSHLPSKQNTYSCVQTAFSATRPLLLLDPEHLTAANFRKRYLKALQSTSTSDFETALRRDLLFTTSILTSPLHRQSKSPTLWYHRHFLLTAFPCDSLRSVLLSELDVVSKSGERHPKNYYAWQYARRLFGRFVMISEEDFSVLYECVEKVREWCVQHPGDISGWMFLAWMLRGRPPAAMEIVKGVILSAIRFQQANEALWVFVRTVLADGTVDTADFLEMLHGYQGDSPFGEQVAQAIAWVNQNTNA